MRSGAAFRIGPWINVQIADGERKLAVPSVASGLKVASVRDVRKLGWIVVLT